MDLDNSTTPEEIPDHPPAGQAPRNPTLFYCSAPRCGKFFNRKEHLTRHVRSSHSSQPQHECPICGRRYARSDVLKRHVENHPQNPHSRQPRLSPCSACAERKTRCDAGIPCQSCTRAHTECSRWTAGSPEAAAPRTQPVLRKNDKDSSQQQQQQALTGTASTVHVVPSPSGSDDYPPAWLATATVTTTTAATAGQQQQQQQHSPWSLLPGVPFQPQTVHTPDSSLGLGTTQQQGFAPSGSPSAPADLSGLDLQTLYDPSALQRLIQTYFSVVHPFWPILHRPTFRVDKCSPLLLKSMVLLASLMEDGYEHSSMGPMVLSSVFASQLIGDELHIPIQTLQAMLLCIVYCVTKTACSTMLFRGLCLNGYLIAACRHQQILSGRHEHPGLQDKDALEVWLAQEERNRLAYSCLRMDAYLSILLDHPPSIRYFELSIPLPKLTGLWDATSDEARSRLQWSTPAGRERALFCNIIRDALEEDGQHGRRRCFPLTKLDYHLGLCALQGGVWEAAGEAHSFATDELSVKPGPGNAIIVWASHIDYWKRTMETSCRLSQQYFSSPLLAATDSSSDDKTDDEAGFGCSDDRFSPYTLLLWHMAALKMHAPIPILQASANLRRLSPAPVSLRNYDLGARIRMWMKTPCARKSCWYAAQISRVVSREAAAAAVAVAATADIDTGTVTPAQALLARARQLLINPLANHSMFLAAIVASSFAFYATSCSVCSMLELHPDMSATAAAAAAAAAAATPVVDLYTADEDEVGLQAWFQAGTGHSVWGPAQIPVCRCSFDGLTAWLREALVADRTLELAFVGYTEKLRTG